MDQHWSRFQQRLEDPLWELGFGAAVFLAGIALWVILWRFWPGAAVIGGLFYLFVGMWYLRVKTPLQRTLTIGFFLATMAILAYAILTNPFDSGATLNLEAPLHPRHSR